MRTPAESEADRFNAALYFIGWLIAGFVAQFILQPSKAVGFPMWVGFALGCLSAAPCIAREFSEWLRESRSESWSDDY